MSEFRVTDRPWHPPELRYMVQELRGLEWVNLCVVESPEMGAAFIRDRLGMPKVVFEAKATFR